MVIGAGWNGARSFTATSGPGISLMSEFIGLAYFAEIPAVLINVQRGGPSTGMPTRTQQADVLACAYASHGDTRHVLLFPEDPYECFEMSAQALDLAERLQTPIFVMSDLDIGMNQRLCRPFAWDDSKEYDRGKVMTREALDAGTDFGRYLDVDGDGIPYRTYPGTHPTKGGYFTRGTTKNAYAGYSEAGADYIYNMQRLRAEVRDRQVAGAAAGAHRGQIPGAFRRDLLRLDRPGDARGARRARRAGHLHQRPAHPRLPVPERDRRLHRRALEGVRARTELRRATDDAAGQRSRRQPGQPDFRAALRRHADHRALHHPGDRRARFAPQRAPAPNDMVA
jgi:hypothetical protein